MKVDNIITLSSGVNYLLLDELNYDNNKYFFCVKVDESKTKPINEYVFVKEDRKDDRLFATIIKETNIIEKLYSLLILQFKEESEN